MDFEALNITLTILAAAYVLGLGAYLFRRWVTRADLPSVWGHWLACFGLSGILLRYCVTVIGIYSGDAELVATSASPGTGALFATMLVVGVLQFFIRLYIGGLRLVIARKPTPKESEQLAANRRDALEIIV